ncbi:MAG: hypothetical protein AMXMBFR7_21010 [Planctomycetota bacterium]
MGDLHAPHGNANCLTHAALDPNSKEAEYRLAAVEVAAVRAWVPAASVVSEPTEMLNT